MKKLIMFSLAIGATLSLQAQTFEMVKDINPAFLGASSDLSHTTEYNGKFYFSANDGTNGYELWVSDGTSAGTQMLKDINPSRNSLPAGFTEYNGKLYFIANDSINGAELWVTDGSSAGTQMVKDINPSGGAMYYDLFNYTTTLAVSNGKLYFNADDGTNGMELWVTDGSSAGTQMVKDINPSGDSDPSRFREYNGKLYFSADNGINGRELWVTDGTDTGTQMLKNINPIGDASITNIAEYNGKLYFGANNATNGVEPWVTDGTAAGTQMLKNINPSSSSSPNGFTECNGKLYFSANDSLNNHELWVTDGTAAGTQKVKEIRPSSLVGSNPNRFIECNGKLYFRADGGIGGVELWVTDGTDTGTQLIDINPSGSSSPSDFIEYNGRLYFTAYDAATERDLWETDGTVAGTQKARPSTALFPNSLGYDPAFIVFGGSLYYSAFYDSAAVELWKLSTTPLPLTWLSFDATAIADHTASLNWKTAAETNLSHFEVERSNDGKNFKAIGKVQSAENPAEENEYQFIDDNVENNVVYYRLKQVDIDERFSYSEIAKVSFQADRLSNNLSIVPNPGRGFISLQIADFSNQESIKVTDMNGRLVFHAAVSGSAVNIPAAPGIYVVSLLDEAGAVLESKKAIVE